MPTTKSFWQRLVSLLPWVHEEEPDNGEIIPEADYPSTAESDQDADINARPIYRLVVDFDTGSWPSSGVLKEMGYKVGKNGLGPTDRRQILQEVFRVTLVANSPEAESYIREWGSPESMERAAKIERCLAGFASGARRRSADMSEAIADWESDLSWLTTIFGC